MDYSSYSCYRMVGRLYGLSGRWRDNPPHFGGRRYSDNLQTGYRSKGVMVWRNQIFPVPLFFKGELFDLRTSDKVQINDNIIWQKI